MRPVGVEAEVEAGRSRVFCLESESELESGRNADSGSGPESQDTTRQQTKNLAKWLCIVPKTLKHMKKGVGACI